MAAEGTGHNSSIIATICYFSIQMNDPLENAELLAFATAADARSLSRAAAELGIPRATLGRRLARLEQRLGARLLRRTTRSLALTDAGEALYRHARIVLDAVRHAEASVRRTDNAIRGDLRVSVPTQMPVSFHVMVCRFAHQHPEVRLQIHFASQMVDLHRGGYDVALRAGMEIQPGLIARTIARSVMIAVAAPAYLAAHGVPRTPADLSRHRCLLGFARGELPQTHWPLRGGGTLHVEGCLFANDIVLQQHAALSGVGIALLPLLIAQPALDRGKLVRVLPGSVEVETRFAAVYPEREFVPPQVRAFVDAAVAWGRTLAQGELPAPFKLEDEPEVSPPAKRKPGVSVRPASGPRRPPRPRTQRAKPGRR
jgi:DNA-binding transcriptional LysR family regulator